MIDLVICAVIAILVFYIIHVMLSCIRKNRVDRIKYIRSFKKGKFTFIFFPSFILFLIGTLYSGLNPINAFLSSISNTINLIALKFEYSSISKLIADNNLYSITVYSCFFLVFVNAMLFFASLFNQRLFELFSRLKIGNPRKNEVLILGYNEENINIVDSLKDRNINTFVIGHLSSDECNDLYLKGTGYVRDGYLEVIENRIKSIEKRDGDLTIIINTFNDELNIRSLKNMISILAEDAKFNGESILAKLRICVFGSPSCESLYHELEAMGHGCIHYINKYKLIAFDLVDRHPLASCLDSRHIDYSTTLIKQGVDISYCIIGFGKTGREALFSLISDNQFLRECNGRKTLKEIKYTIIEKESQCTDKNFVHCLQRYYGFMDYCMKNELKDDYLELAPLPAKLEFHNDTDINSTRCIETIYKSLDIGNDLSFTTFIICFGSDLENIDFAKKLVDNLNGWAVKDYRIFVKVRKKENVAMFSFDEKIQLFGIESEVVYNYEKIRNDPFTKIAIARDLSYETLKANKSKTITSDEENNWYKKNATKRKNNIYGALNIKSKLALLGLDVKENSSDSHQLAKRYNDEARENLAIQEHYRWNAFMICSGFIPVPIGRIKDGEGNGTDYEKREHANICTWEALDDYAKIVSSKTGKSINETDVKVYDYQAMDCCKSYLECIGCGLRVKES